MDDPSAAVLPPNLPFPCNYLKPTLTIAHTSSEIPSHSLEHAGVSTLPGPTPRPSMHLIALAAWTSWVHSVTAHPLLTAAADKPLVNKASTKRTENT